MNITFQGNPLTLKGTQLKIGDTLTDFTVTDNTLAPLSLASTKGVRVFLAVPSIDTDVCDIEVRKFNEKIKSIENVTCYTISMDLPFAQARWCGCSDIKNVITASDYKDKEFANATGTYINELGLLTRACIVVDNNNKVLYTEYLKEITKEPNYDGVFEAVLKAI